MDGFDPERDTGLTDVVELLERVRPVLTVDELGRVDQRLNAFRAPRRAPRPRSRLAVVICLTFGLLFMTTGAGLAISGFATTGTATHAQYPDRPTGGPPPQTPGTARAGHRAQGRHSRSSNLGAIPPAGQTLSVSVSLSQAEANNNPLPFTGYNAIPILVAGIALIVTGAAVNRRTRGS